MEQESEEHGGGDAAALSSMVEVAKRRCRAVENRTENLKVNASCKRTLLRLIHSELSFLSRFPNTHNPTLPLSVNIGHLEAVVHILQQPFIAGVSRVCKPIPVNASGLNNGNKDTTACSKGAHIDIVCTINGNPVWFIVSDRNPKYISWLGQEACKNKGLKTRIEQVLDVAHSTVTLKPTSVILFFSNGLDDTVFKKIQSEFGATNPDLNFSYFDCNFFDEPDGEWVDIIARSYKNASVLEIKVERSKCNSTSLTVVCEYQDSLRVNITTDLPIQEDSAVHLGSSLCSLISQMENGDVGEAEFINFDTTALIAIVSGISNGNTKKLLATPEDALRARFKSNYEFVIVQVMSEIQHPIHTELTKVISGKRGIICESVCSEFKDLVSMCGGPNEKLRANFLLNHLKVVADRPSPRMISLQSTRKLAMKNKVVFGTGDYYRAPTLTANMAFVRAVSQTGMSLFTFQHRPRALTGD